jgi:hypothetical protein
MKSNCVYRNNTIGIYQFIVIGMLCYGRKAWIMSKNLEIGPRFLNGKYLEKYMSKSGNCAVDSHL